TYSRNKNTGITDVINGVSLDVKGVGSSTVTVDVRQGSWGSVTVDSAKGKCTDFCYDLQYVTIPTPGPVTITWEMRASTFWCFSETPCLDDPARVEIWGPNFNFRREPRLHTSGTTTVEIQPYQVGTYTLLAIAWNEESLMPLHFKARMTVSWNHNVRNAHS